ncbi:uncharacterized protein PGTG_21602 [Puccinia graminis f. sp. tritici CRL 75-36-700-3]|uniref:Uncharacterized protein n=1 Tax=Puccinia graminis f. sp. tritici (strain CRL 75-36-700-3 / race SCCL) TaxID=418459 RepID=H6QS26_PUCGT|nr:uncharacterized protein PGTG_21602 [Puccinia graminis f. sp. tritici CRL 75-36-700-3]EHS63472.1 hypothetical protein PGTG_21602 [Puccinia graminis f. sp. tritici CRL 75-36-700-3]
MAIQPWLDTVPRLSAIGPLGIQIVHHGVSIGATLINLKGVDPKLEPAELPSGVSLEKALLTSVLTLLSYPTACVPGPQTNVSYILFTFIDGVPS